MALAVGYPGVFSLNAIWRVSLLFGRVVILFLRGSTGDYLGSGNLYPLWNIGITDQLFPGSAGETLDVDYQDKIFLSDSKIAESD